MKVFANLAYGAVAATLLFPFGGQAMAVDQQGDTETTQQQSHLEVLQQANQPQQTTRGCAYVPPFGWICG